jgi:exodeoxyribonuclease V alpha subunit
VNQNEIYTFFAVPTYTRYRKDNFGIYEFYTEQDDLPHLQEHRKDNDIWDFTENIKNKAVYTGIMLGVSQDLDHNIPYNLTAKLEFNEKYNTYQYKIINISPTKPDSSIETKRFLYTILTEKQTNTLIEAYPKIVDDVVNDPDFEPDYEKLKGIGEKTFNKIRQKICDTYIISDLLILLQPLGVTYKMILKLLDGEVNGYLLKQQLEENPYELTRLHGVGFQSIDKFAIKLKPELLKSKQRVIACIKYVLKDIGKSEGHSWIEITKLTQLVKSMVPECRDVYKEVIGICRQEYAEGKASFFYADEKRVGLYSSYITERKIAEKLWALQNADNLYVDVDYEKAVAKTNKQNGFNLTEEQSAAVKSVIENNVTVITGSAGSGKTSIIKAIVNMYAHYDVALTALSAKAARRMTEVTRATASTIHRLLGADSKGFQHNFCNPLYQKLVIIDEASMINSSLFWSILDAVSIGSKIVIVFDFAQLSPIGIGNVASDLLTSKLPIFSFTKIHRQAEKSGILVDANKIRVGESPILEFEEYIVNGELQDMVYLFREQPINNDTFEQLNDLALKTFTQLMEQKISVDDISVIVPRKQSVMNSVNLLNRKIQEIVIPDKVPYMDLGEKRYKLGAKVIQKTNDYNKDVVNGEIGYLIEILKPHKENEYDFIVDFGDKKLIKYKRNELEQIDLAYAITTHSSQGSQYKYVIVVLDMSHFMLLDTCLFYTAITRASEKCYCIAQPKAFIHALSNSKAAARQTFLPEMI